MAKKSGLGSIGKPTKKYYQHNYVDVIKSITPDLYHDTDYSIYGLENDILYSVLGKILKAVDQVSSIVNVSGVTTSSLQQRFILRNNLTNIKPHIFEHKILKPLGSSFEDFTSKEDFKSYLASVILPHITTNAPSTEFTEGVAKYVDPTITDAGSTHDYLIDNLSWMYILNTSGPADWLNNPLGWDPSSQVPEVLADLYDNKPITETASIKLLFEYLWKNREVSDFFDGFIPSEYNYTNAEVSSNTNASGTQLLDGLKTLIGVWYNQNDESSETLDTYLDLYINTDGISDSVERFTPKQVEGGAFTKFLQAVSYGFYDVNSTIQDLEDLVDIERCPPQFLQYLASLIGWQLLTGDVDRWRAQLRKAVYLYKSKGTRRSLEDAVDLIFPGSNITVAEDLQETWECYLPRMIYYLIATESKVLNDPNFGANTLPGLSNDHLFVDNLDLNYRVATDYVISVIHNNAPISYHAPEGGAIYISDKKFELSTWDPTNSNFQGFSHRGNSKVEVPPWENDRFYDNTYISDDQLVILRDVLTGSRYATTPNAPGGGLEIPTSYVDALMGVLEKTGLDDTFYDLSWNKKWKFHTSSMEMTPNLANIVAAGQSSKLSLLDNWSSKSSLMFTSVNLTDIKHTIEGIPIDSNTILRGIETLFRAFTPFHVTIKLFGTEGFADKYQGVTGEFGLDSLCIKIDAPMFDATVSGDTDQVILTNLVPSSLTVSASDVEGSKDIYNDYSLSAQGMVHHISVSGGDSVTVVDSNGYSHRFEYTVSAGATYATGALFDTTGTYVNVSGTTSTGQKAAQFAEAVNHVNTSSLQVSAQHLHSSKDLFWAYGQLPTNHPDYEEGSITEDGPGTKIARNVLLSQQIAGTAGNTYITNTEWGDTEEYTPNQLTTYSFGKNGLNIGMDPNVIRYPSTPRASGRRRNLRYNLNSPAFRRNGGSMPVAYSYLSTSAEGVDTSTYGVHTTEHIPLGYNFSAGVFFSPLGTASGIYDASNDVAMANLPIMFSSLDPQEYGTEYYLPLGRGGKTDIDYSYSGIEVSSTFPCRGILRDPCTSAEDRDSVSQINAVIIRHLISQGKSDNFDTSTLENFEFGPQVHSDFYDNSGVIPPPTYAEGMMYTLGMHPNNNGEYFELSNASGVTWRFIWTDEYATGTSSGLYQYQSYVNSTRPWSNDDADEMRDAVNAAIDLHITATDVWEFKNMPDTASDQSVSRYMRLTQEEAGENGNTTSYSSHHNVTMYNFGSPGLTRGISQRSIPFSENETKIIYSYFNSLVQGKQSRLNTRTSDLYSTSGGYRGYYVDDFGGTLYGINDSISPYGSGVNYELSDD